LGCFKVVLHLFPTFTPYQGGGSHFDEKYFSNLIVEYGGESRSMERFFKQPSCRNPVLRCTLKRTFFHSSGLIKMASAYPLKFQQRPIKLLKTAQQRNLNFGGRIKTDRQLNECTLNFEKVLGDPRHWNWQANHQVTTP